MTAVHYTVSDDYKDYMYGRFNYWHIENEIDIVRVGVDFVIRKETSVNIHIKRTVYIIFRILDGDNKLRQYFKYFK